MRIPGFEIQLNTESLPWHETRFRGVQWYLILDPEERRERGPEKGMRQDSAVLIRMEPGRGYPSHRHLDVEEVLVLAGGYRDEEGTHRAGDYVRYEPGSEHHPVALGDPERSAGADNPACVLFAVARGGIEVL